MKIKDQLKNFPKGNHDDMVDALSYGLDVLKPMPWWKKAWRKVKAMWMWIQVRFYAYYAVCGCWWRAIERWRDGEYFFASFDSEINQLALRLKKEAEEGLAAIEEVEMEQAVIQARINVAERQLQEGWEEDEL